MKRKHLLSLCISAIFNTYSFSQGVHPASGMVSDPGNFTSLSSRPASQPSPELLKTATEAARKHPEFGVMPLNAPCKDCYEVIEKRTATSRYYVMNGTNGSEFVMQNSLGAINYKDKNGYYREKDLNVYATAQPGVFASAHQEEPVNIDLNAKSVTIKTVDNIDIKFNSDLELWGVDKEGNETFISAAKWNNATVGANGLKVSELFDGISLQAFILSGSVKTNFVINAYSASYSQFKWLVIKDNVSAGPNTSLHFTSMAGANGLYNCDVDILSNTGTSIGRINQGTIFDHSRSNAPLYYKMEVGKLGMYVDVDYLKNSNTSYPVVVDPLISTSGTLAQASITGSQQDVSGLCTFSNSCDFPLTMSSPANATITDVTFSMAYRALGACYEEDGAMRVGYNACVSPSTTGYYYFCNNAAPGTCTGTNIDIWADVSSCIPAPSCASYPMTFVLKMFRDCFGAAGCTSGCIQANSPFVVNVYGKTLETLGNTSTGNGTNVQVAGCAGTATLNPTPANGVGPYTYVWTPGGSTGSTLTVTVSTSQTITCNVTDACGTVRTATFTVNPNPSIPAASSLPTKTLTPCAATATFAPTYTTTITTYNWSGPGISGASNSASVVVNQAGTYVLTFTNSAGCTGSNTYTAVNGPPTSTASAVSATITCTNPTATLAPVYTPSSNLTYSWAPVGPGAISGSATNPSVVVSQAGVYQVTMTNTVSGCSSTASYTVVNGTQPPTISAIATQTVSCTNPTVTINPVYNPSSGLTYSWTGTGITPPVTTAGITTTQAGTFAVIATAANGCTATAQYSVTGSTASPTVSIQGAALTCTGPVTLSTTIAPPAGAYTYTWSGAGITSGVNSSTAAVNAAGVYNVNITNGFGCTASDSYTVANNASIPTASAESATINCINTTASLSPTFTPSGNLTYTWSPVGPGAISGSANNASVTVSQPGTYQVAFTNTVNGCQSSATYTVTNDTQAPGISAIATQTITCTTPTVSIAPTYTPSTGLGYSWTGTGITPPVNTASISTTQAGSFAVIAIAANGCTATAQYSVTGSTASPTVSVQGAPLTCTGPVTLSTTITPPSGTYTYTWSGPGITSGTNASTVTLNAPGAYVVTITNEFACTASDTYTVANNAGIPTASAESATINCINTTASLSPTYTPSNDLTYTWTSVGPGTISGSANNASVTVSQPGTYQVAFTNTLTGCQSSATYTVTDDTQVPVISAIAMQTITCTTPTVNIAPTYTPSTGLSYDWAGPGITPPVSTASISTTQGGTYTLTATAANGCTATAQYQVDDESALPAVSIQGGTLTCSGPLTMSTTVTPPTGTYTYTWTGPGIVGGANSSTVAVNAAGAYDVTITNAFGCTAMDTYTVASNSNIPTASSVSATITCSNPTATLSPVYSPSSGLTYSWTPVGVGTISGSATNPSVVVSQAGVYQVTMTNTVTNCQSSNTYTVSNDTQAPSVSTVATQTVTCANPVVTISPTYTPSAGISYSWSGPGITPPVTTASISTSQAGTYTVTATAANGCTATAQYSVVVNATPITAVAQGTVLPCNLSPASIGVTTTPAGTYTYSWSGPGIVSGGSSATPTVGAPGNYTVIVTAANGCSTTATANVTSQAVTAGFTPTSASGIAPFAVSFTNQSQGASSYQWTFGDGNTSTASDPSNTYQSTGTYTVQMVASNGTCSDTAYGVITVDATSMISIPNVFTPNGDNVNDLFMITTQGIKDLELNIFNRWGEKLYSASGVNAAWNGTQSGKAVSEGTYFYIVTATGNDGKTYEKQGYLSLFR